MKRFRKIFLLFIFLLVITSCKKSSTYDVSLNGSSNSDYNWVYTIDDESIVKVVDEKYYGDENEDEISGLGGTYTFKVQPLKQGTAKISFNYMKTWDENEVLYNYVVEFNVSKDLKIEKVSESGNYLSLVKFFDVGEDKVDLEGEFNDYKLIFDSQVVKIDNDNCNLLLVYNYQDELINTYGISISNNNIYKMVDNKFTLIK